MSSVISWGYEKKQYKCVEHYAHLKRRDAIIHLVKHRLIIEKWLGTERHDCG